MYPSTPLPPPLTHPAFYILLALARTEAHGYAIGAIAHNDSGQAVTIADGSLYPLLKRLVKTGLVEDAGLQPAGKTGQDRQYYRLSNEGALRLKAELQRMRYATRVGESLGYFDDDTPLDIQRLLASMQ